MSNNKEPHRSTYWLIEVDDLNQSQALMQVVGRQIVVKQKGNLKHVTVRKR